MNTDMKTHYQPYLAPAVHVVRLEQKGIMCTSSIQASDMANDNYYNQVFEYEN